jgi:DNA-binding NarL/FixJ family response regulator
MADLLTTTTALPTRVLCVDDNHDMTAVMRMVIDAEPGMQCVGCLGSADKLRDEVRRLHAPPQGHAPLVILLDATMPGKSPFLAMTEVAAEFPDARTIIYSGHDDPAFIERALEAGAWDCISKRDDPEAIVRAVKEVVARDRLARTPKS